MKNFLLLIAVVALAIFPLVIHRSGAEPAKAEAPTIEVQKSDTAKAEAPAAEPAELFTGSDDQAKDMISKISPGYKPWFTPLWEPPSGEVESLLFTLQGVIGAGALFFYLGYIYGRSSKRKTEGANAPS